LARFNLDGTLDTTFGNGAGMVMSDFRGAQAFGLGMQIGLADGRFILAGVGAPANSHGARVAVARYFGFTRTILTPIVITPPHIGP